MNLAARGHATPQAVRVDSFAAKSSGTGIAASGEVDLAAKDIGLRFDGTLNHTSLAMFTPVAEGAVSGSFAVRGTARQPDASANLTVDGLKAYGETLGDTVVGAVKRGVHVMASTGAYGPPEESMDLLVRELEEVASESTAPVRTLGLKFGRWLRSQYKLFPLTAENVRVAEEQELVVTYSSSLAHLYWTNPARPLTFDEIREDPQLIHSGLGLL